MLPSIRNTIFLVAPLLRNATEPVPDTKCEVRNTKYQIQNISLAVQLVIYV